MKNSRLLCQFVCGFIDKVCYKTNIQITGIKFYSTIIKMRNGHCENRKCQGVLILIQKSNCLLVRISNSLDLSTGPILSVPVPISTARFRVTIGSGRQRRLLFILLWRWFRRCHRRCRLLMAMRLDIVATLVKLLLLFGRLTHHTFLIFLLLFDKQAQPAKKELLIVPFQDQLMLEHRYHVAIRR